MPSFDARPRYARSLALLVALACSGTAISVAHAQVPSPGAPASNDEVRTKSGGFVKGEIVESLPGQYVTIIPRGSNDRRQIAWSELSEIVRNGVVETIEQPVEPVPVEPEPEPEPSVPEPTPPIEQPVEGPAEAEPEGMQVVIQQDTDKRGAAVLYHIDGEAYGSNGRVSVHAIAYSEICTSPCKKTRLLESHGEFFIWGDKTVASKRFRLPMREDGYTLDVKMGSRGLRVGGYVLWVSSLVASAFMAAGPLLKDMPKTSAIGVWVGAGLVGIGGTAAGITMFAFSRSQVKVLPR